MSTRVLQRLYCHCQWKHLGTLCLSAMACKDTPCADVNARAEKRDRILLQLLESHMLKPENIPEEASMSPSYRFCSKRSWERKFRNFKETVKALQEMNVCEEQYLRDPTSNVSLASTSMGTVPKPVCGRSCRMS